MLLPLLLMLCITRILALDRNENFKKLVLSHLHEKSILREVTINFSNFNFNAGHKFMTVGLEASGHHLIEMLSIEGYPSPGRQWSFSSNAFERKNRDTNQRSFAADSLDAWKFSKYLLTLREPLSHFTSFLHRNWGVRKAETLTTHYDAWISSATQMQIFIHSLVAIGKPMMVFPYDDIYPNKRLYASALAQFLNMNETQLEGWTGKIRPPKTYDILGKLKIMNWGRWETNSSNRTYHNFAKTFHQAIKSKSLYDIYLI